MTTAPARIRGKQRPADRIFSGSAVFAGSLILVILAAVAIFLIAQSLPGLVASPDDLKGDAPNFWAYVGPLVFGTVWSAALALIIALPISIGIALFISHYAPRRLASGLGYLIDLLAAIPSVVYGLWGAGVLVPFLRPFFAWLTNTFGWFPLFAPDPNTGQASPTGRVALAAGIVLAIMIIPIITAVTREVFLQTPKLHEEAALAMGATRWEMVRMAVFPFGRSGVIGATMLGLGRALGETMAVYMILSSGLSFSFGILQSGKHDTIAAYIASQFPEANNWGVSALITMGLALFVITLLVNMLARWIVSRRAEFSGAN